MTVGEHDLVERGDGVDLAAMWAVIWLNRYLILICAFVCGSVAVYLALTATPIYRAETVVSEVREKGLGNGLINQFSGLANLAGVNLGGTTGSESQAVLKSRHLIEEFIQRNDMFAELTADMKGKQLTLSSVAKRFKEKMITIREDKVVGLTTITIDGPDPVVTAQRTNGFIVIANEMIRGRAIDSAKKNLVFLNEQVGRTNEVELRKVLYDLIENETKTLMLANARAEYAFTVVDPAVPPDSRISPRRTLMTLLGIVIGGLLGAAVGFVRHGIARRRVAILANSG